jgi:hypothetical protein
VELFPAEAPDSITTGLGRQVQVFLKTVWGSITKAIISA